MGAVVSAVLAAAYLRITVGSESRWRMVWYVAGLALAGGFIWTLWHWFTIGVGLDSPRLPRAVGVHALILSIWSSAVVGLLMLREADRRARRTAEVERALLEARHQALLYQINPHFLFNALNSVRALVDEEPARAREMITGLSDVLRRALQANPLAVGSFSDELDVIETYLAVEKLRFEDRLFVVVDVDEAARRATFPTLLLQPLVENAITHGRGAPLRITLSASVTSTTLNIRVSNSGSLRAPIRSPARPARRHGIGLANVRERLALMYGSRATLSLFESEGAVHADLSLPLQEDAQSDSIESAGSPIPPPTVGDPHPEGRRLDRSPFSSGPGGVS